MVVLLTIVVFTFCFNIVNKNTLQTKGYKKIEMVNYQVMDQ